MKQTAVPSEILPQHHKGENRQGLEGVRRQNLRGQKSPRKALQAPLPGLSVLVQDLKANQGLLPPPGLKLPKDRPSPP